MGARFLLALLPLLLLPPLPRGEGGTVCGSCAGPLHNGSVVGRYCAGRAGAQPWGRCCVLGGPGPPPGHIVGLDLSNCSLRSLPAELPQAAAAATVDLTGNPLSALPNTSFLGFTRLQSLAVPLSVECPGGSGAWERETTLGSSRLCEGQRDPCNGSAALVPLCPEPALCAPAGPGLSRCLCRPPFHGYKCLRQGAFPLPPAAGLLGAATAALALLLWGTQRRGAGTP